MDPDDHKLASSRGSAKSANEYRESIAGKIRDSGMRGAMAEEVRDVRRAAEEGSNDRRKYDKAMKEMLKEAKEKGVVPGRRR